MYKMLIKISKQYLMKLCIVKISQNYFPLINLESLLTLQIINKLLMKNKTLIFYVNKITNVQNIF